MMPATHAPLKFQSSHNDHQWEKKVLDQQANLYPTDRKLNWKEKLVLKIVQKKVAKRAKQATNTAQTDPAAR